jgi:hypothetical protein
LTGTQPVFGTQVHSVDRKNQTVSEHPGVRGGGVMLWTIFVVLLVLWFLGMVSSYTLGGYIHILLVLAVVALLVRLISGRSVI